MADKTTVFSLIFSGGVSSGLSSAFKKVQTSSTALTNALKKVNQSAGKIQEYRALSQELDSLKAKMKAGGDAAADAAKQIQKKSERLKQLAQDLKAAGIGLQDLAAHEKRLARDTADLNRRLESMNKAAQFKGMRENAFSGWTSVVAPVAALAAPIKLAVDFEEKMADVKKVVDFDSPAQFKKMSDDILLMSTRIPMAADGLADIVASAGQSGIAQNELRSFTETAAKMGVAFDMSAGAAGKTMANWRAGMKLSQAQVVDLADAVNHLSNATNAEAAGLAEVIQRQGAVAMSAGLTEIQVAALGSAFLSSGASPEIAATGMKNFTNALTKGAAATKRQDAAFQSLGLDAVQVAKDMQTDAEGTMIKVLEAVSKVDKYKQSALVSTLFGEESKGAIMPLLTNLEALKKSFDLVSDRTKYTGSMQKEFEARSKTTANAIKLLKNNMNVLGVTIGSILLPVFNQAVVKFTQVINKVIAFAQANPKLTSTLVGLAGGLTAGFVGFKTFGMVSQWVVGGLGELLFTIKALPGGITKILGVFRVLNLTLLTCPWFWVVGGIVALGLALHKLGVLKPFVSGVMDSLSGIGATIQTALAPGVDSFKKALEPLPGLMKSWGISIDMTTFQALGMMLGDVLAFALEKVAGFVSWNIQWFVKFGQLLGSVAGDISLFFAGEESKIGNFFITIKDWIVGVYDSITGAFNDAIDWLSKIDLADVGAKIVNSLIAGIKSLGGLLRQEFYNLLPNWVKSSETVQAALGISLKEVDGARAEGGPVGTGKTYVVGEKGPELFTAGNSGQIIPNKDLGSQAPTRRQTRDNFQHLQNLEAEANAPVAKAPAAPPAPPASAAPARRQTRDNYQHLQDLEAEANAPAPKAPAAQPKTPAHSPLMADPKARDRVAHGRKKVNLAAPMDALKPKPALKPAQPTGRKGSGSGQGRASKPGGSAPAKPNRDLGSLAPRSGGGRRSQGVGGAGTSGGGSGGGPGGGGINITINVTVNAAGGNPGEIKSAVSQGLAEGREKLKKALQGVMKNEKRLSYA